jgi:hypothetical protein
MVLLPAWKPRTTVTHSAEIASHGWLCMCERETAHVRHHLLNIYIKNTLKLGVMLKLIEPVVFSKYAFHSIILSDSHWILNTIMSRVIENHNLKNFFNDKKLTDCYSYVSTYMTGPCQFEGEKPVSETTSNKTCTTNVRPILHCCIYLSKIIYIHCSPTK